MAVLKDGKASDPDPKKNMVLKLKLNLTREKCIFTMCQSLFEVYSTYIPIKPVGKGSYGVVCSAMNTETNDKVAIKKINNVFENNVEALRALRELVILRQTSHENVIALKDVMVSNSKLIGTSFVSDSKANFNDLYMVYELMDSDLDHIIKSAQPLSNDQIQFFLLQLLTGLNYLHSLNILHRDLKPGNLLVNANCDLKICDFGLSRTSTTEPQLLTEYVVTRWYRAPELLMGADNYGTSIDMWSVGCILAELLGRTPLFRGTDPLHQLKLILEILGTQSESNLEFIENVNTRRFINSLSHSSPTNFARLFPHADPLAIDLLERMLIFDPTKRITANEALQHPYMFDLCDVHEDSASRFPLDIKIDENAGEKMIRELMWREMLFYHPEEATKC